MAESCEPHDEPGRHLPPAQEAEITGDLFTGEPTGAQVATPVRDDSAGISSLLRADKALLLAPATGGATRVPIPVSSHGRAQPFPGDFPNFEGGLRMQSSRIPERAGDGMGIVPNPGRDVGFDREPDMAGHRVWQTPPNLRAGVTWMEYRRGH